MTKGIMKAIKDIGLIIMAVLALGVLSIIVYPQPSYAATPVTSCGTNINTPGQYMLTGNLSCSGTAVTISADDVHFNLNGFTIDGDESGIGVDVGSCVATSGVHINNGTITD